MSTNGAMDATQTVIEGIKASESPRYPWLLYGTWRRAGFTVTLFLVYTSNFVDRIVISVLLDPIKREFDLSDTTLGLLSGFAFAFFYGLAVIPFARWADRGNRATVIAFALGMWSIMTVLCGVAQSWWQLLFARTGVGMAASGTEAPTQSLIADYFAPGLRARAIALMNTTGNLGYMLGIGLGGYLTATHGWRITFIAFGLPGLLLAIIARLTLCEPRCLLGFPGGHTKEEPVRDTLTHLGRNRSFVFAVLGMAVYSTFAYGVSVFLPSFAVRRLHVSLAELGLTLGPAVCVSTAIGALSGGWLADRLAGYDLRWHAWLPALACVCAVPFYFGTFAAHDLRTFITLECFAEALLAAGLPGVYAGIHAVCGNRRRATAFAIMFLLTTLVGLGLGPLAVGAISDGLSGLFPAENLRLALMTMLVPLLLAAAMFGVIGRAIREDANGSINKMT